MDEYESICESIQEAADCIGNASISLMDRTKNGYKIPFIFKIIQKCYYLNKTSISFRWLMFRDKLPSSGYTLSADD